MRRYVDRMDLAFAARRPHRLARRRGDGERDQRSRHPRGVRPVRRSGNGEQALNAAAAVRAGAAILIPDAEFTADRVRTEVVPLLLDEAGARR